MGDTTNLFRTENFIIQSLDSNAPAEFSRPVLLSRFEDTNFVATCNKHAVTAVSNRHSRVTFSLAVLRATEEFLCVVLVVVPTLASLTFLFLGLLVYLGNNQTGVQNMFGRRSKPSSSPLLSSSMTSSSSSLLS